MINNAGADHGGASVRLEVGPRGANQSLKKGPWTAAEDAILIDYVRIHGEGNWNSVQKNSGLLRCGKSCRLRWANHLRPNLKKGSFTPEEERIIIELHAKLGNKWARMASQLPGRTDNEIKNYWNTRMKRRQRAGFPVYPQEFQKEAVAVEFQQNQQKYPGSFWSSPHQRPMCTNPSLSHFNPTNYCAANPMNPLQNHLNSSMYSNPSHQQFKVFDPSNNCALAFSLPHVPPYVDSPTSETNLGTQGIPTATPPSINYNSLDFENNNISFTSLIMGAEVEPNPYLPSLKSELPSFQISSDLMDPIVSESTRDVCAVEKSSEETEHDRKRAREDDTNSGLLDALLQEAKLLSCKRKSSYENSSISSKKGKEVLDESEEEEVEKVDRGGDAKNAQLSLKNDSETSVENQGDDLASFQSSVGMKSNNKEAMEEMNSMDDDLLILLNNFPSSTPLPEWYRKTKNESIGSSIGSTGEEREHEQEDVSMKNVSVAAAANEASPSLEWALGSCYWKNMPGIC
ncbi:hypothetical protein K2173_018642 [Erythroxylum novogranatense]|uniref:Uncharacterized protein n=1 Tax=Erythroxylum novogranatense TaxID=1862640 RepID=A0AAV8SAC0_9ROSI|nr:hypothetical protein K2173_018642 [Erythroxylum novogranatense]